MHQMAEYFLSFTLLLLLSTQALSQNEPTKEEIATGVNQLALKLNKLFYQPSSKGNVLFSPINIYSALALIHLAAKSKTRTELTELLGFPKDENNHQKAHETLSQILRTVENTTKVPIFVEPFGSKDEEITNINIADGIFIQKGVDLNPSYVSQAQSFYKAEISNLDFVNDGSKSTDVINQYVSKNTKGRINKVFDEPLTPDTRIILASVLYFKATWDETFSEFATTDATFDTGSGNVNVKMMSQTDDVPYINLPKLKAQAIQLRYAGNDVSMIVLLPNVDQSLDNVIQSLDSDVLKDIATNMQYNYVNYKFPKTKFGWSDKIDKHIQSLGVKEVFSNSADLSNMLTSAKLQVSEITHITEIEINEKGTEASAVTVTKMVLTSLVQHPEPVQFVVNRPFVFYILHHSTNTILFLGSVKNPNGK